MNRAEEIQAVLEHYFPNPSIPLEHTSDYTLLIAVVLSARCTDAMVNRVTPILFELADTPMKMVNLEISTIQEVIKPCGLSLKKAKNIFNLSQVLIDEYKGRVPDTFEALEALAGVGHKTASVVMSQAFNKPAFAVDTHIFRCAKRWGLSEGKTVEAVERDLKKVFEKSCWSKLHLQIIYFARAYCTSRGHQKNSCPICSLF